MLSEINGYKIKPEWFIGKGGFGSVYKAEKNGKFYAIKVFQTQFLIGEYKSRIDQEVKALQKIKNPNVVKLYDFGTFKENEFEYYYIVMDFIEGKTLASYVGTIDEKTTIQFIESILDTINAVHSTGIIHRDLKPENIIINQKGTPIILDFGLAKFIDYSSITQTGERVGTFWYMSPEQITDSKNIDFRSDYFSVGLIFYILLTGALPYDATNLPALVDQIKNQYPKNPSELNSNISNQTENVILKLLEKEPYKRFQTIEDIKNTLKLKPVKRPKKLDLSIRHLVRLQHTEKGIFEEALKEKLIEKVIFPANFFKFYHHTVKLLRTSGIPFTTDPATNRLTYTVFSKTVGVQELPYSSGSEVTPVQVKDFHSISQVQDYVKKVFKFQIDNGVTELAAPFFYSKNSNDEWFNINLKLLKESVDYRDQNHKNYPLWAGICMNVENWYDENEKNKILNNYVKVHPDGYFIYGDPIGNKSNLTQLFHYADLLKKLQQSSSLPVVACRVNGLGLVLLGLGISGISSGVASLDNFSESILSDTHDGYSLDPRYYISELLSLITLKKGIPTKLADISKSSIGKNLKCNCKYCVNISSGKLTSRNMKLHFLVRRQAEIKEIISIKETERLSFIETKLQQAIIYARTLSNEGKKVGDFSHLNTWLNLIQQFKKQS